MNFKKYVLILVIARMLKLCELIYKIDILSRRYYSKRNQYII